MKKVLVALAFSVASLMAQAEASFDQIQTLIQQQNYSAAEKGLEEIIRNHPKSAKAFYAMAQAQAGLGNQEKAKKALDIATGLNPTLDFAPASSVESLKQAITPQVKKIEAIEESHFWRDFVIGFILFAGAGGFIYVMYNRKKEEEAEAKRKEEDERIEALRQQREKERQEEAAREILRQHPNYGNERFDPSNPDVLLPKKTKAQLKEETAALAIREANARAERAEAKANEEAALARGREAYARMNSTPAPTTTVVNNGSSSGDFAMGMVLGNMMGGSHHHDHETTRVIEREVVRETPKRDTSWDDTPSTTSTRSSSWDDTPSSSSRSSSWDDDSSSRSSSSWSSSSSDSSSSWSDSSSSSSSSSSWD